MKYLRTILICLLLLKLVSFIFLLQAKAANANIKEFVLYQMDSNFEKDKVRNLRAATKESIKGIPVNELFEIVLNKLDTLYHNKAIEKKKYLDAFISVDSLFVSPFKYQYNHGLTEDHNVSILQLRAYQHILSNLNSILKENLKHEILKPVVMAVNEKDDSISIRLSFVPSIDPGEYQATYTYNNKDQEIDSLPINIGDINGLFKVCLTHKMTKERSCFQERF